MSLKLLIVALVNTETKLVVMSDVKYPLVMTRENLPLELLVHFTIT